MMDNVNNSSIIRRKGGSEGIKKKKDDINITTTSTIKPKVIQRREREREKGKGKGRGWCFYILLFWVCICVLVTLFLYFGVSYITNEIGDVFQYEIERGGSRLLDTPVRLEGVDVSLWNGKIILYGLKVKNKATDQSTTTTSTNSFSASQVDIQLDYSTLLSEDQLKEPFIKVVPFKSVIFHNPKVFWEGIMGDNILMIQNAISNTATKRRSDHYNIQEYKETNQIIDEATHLITEFLSERVKIENLIIENPEVEAILFGKKIGPWNLPSLELRDIGSDKGISIKEVMQKTMDEIILSISKSISTKIKDLNIGIDINAEKIAEVGKDMFNKIKDYV